jgi:hypothetical protein
MTLRNLPQGQHMSMSHSRRAIRALLLGAALAVLARFPADAATGLSSTLQQAQRAARDAGQRGVALLVLARHDDSALSLRTEAIEAHDPAVRFAMRAYDLVVLAPAGHGLFRLLAPRDACEGITACAEDAFLEREFTLGRLRALNTAAGRVPLLMVFDTRHAQPVGTAYGVDDRAQALRFAAGLRTASPSHPLAAYSDRLLED